MVRRALVIVLFTALVLGGAAHGSARDAHATARRATTDQLTIIPDPAPSGSERRSRSAAC